MGRAGESSRRAFTSTPPSALRGMSHDEALDASTCKHDGMASGGYRTLDVALEGSTGLHHLRPYRTRRALCGVLPGVLTPVEGDAAWEDLEVESRCQRCKRLAEDPQGSA